MHVLRIRALRFMLKEFPSAYILMLIKIKINRKSSLPLGTITDSFFKKSIFYDYCTMVFFLAISATALSIYK